VVSPTVTPETVYVGEGRGVAAVDRSEGTRRWRLPVDGLVGSPVVVGGTIYLQTSPRRGKQHRLLAIRAP
jgi:outer membrane protein assembly factor BamB